MLLLLLYFGMQSHLWPQIQALFLPPRSQSKGLRFWGVLVLVTNLSVPYDWLLIVKKSQEVFLKRIFSIFKARYPPKHQLDVFLQSLNLMLYTWVWNVDQEIVEFVLLCGFLMEQSWQNVLLVLTQLGIQTFTSSTLPISFLSMKVSILIALYLKQIVRF